MSGSVSPLSMIVGLLLPPSEDAPEVFEQKTKAKTPKPKQALKQPKGYAPSKSYRHGKGYQIARKSERRNKDDHE